MTVRALLVAAILIASPADAQDDLSAGLPEQETRIIVYGDDPCPEANEEEEEIVICARQPEEERYRIPRALREQRDRPTEVSWGSRVDDLEDASRPERPGSCSVVGSFGQSGCAAAAIRQWYNDRRANRRR